MNPVYVATARLLVEVAPVVFGSGQFALKGGTAINLFFRNVPRLSVDLDLVFLDHRLPRGTALEAINEALRVAKHELDRRGLKVHSVSSADMGETKLIVQRDDTDVLVEFLPGHVPGLRFVTIEREFSELLHGRRVDMVTPKFLNARIRESVLSAAEPLYVAA